MVITIGKTGLSEIVSAITDCRKADTWKSNNLYRITPPGSNPGRCYSICTFRINSKGYFHIRGFMGRSLLCAEALICSNLCFLIFWVGFFVLYNYSFPYNREEHKMHSLTASENKTNVAAAILLWRHTSRQLKLPDKIGAGVKTATPGYGLNIIFGGEQIVFGHSDPIVQQVSVKRFSCDGLKNLTEIIGMISKKLRNFVVGKG